MFLLDTNVISELKKIEQGHANANVVQWNASTDVFRHWLSAITILELYKGVLNLERRDLVQGALLREWYESRVLRDFKDRILPVDAETAQICAGLHIPIQNQTVMRLLQQRLFNTT